MDSNELRLAAKNHRKREIIASLSTAIDRTLGENTSPLLFKTMHLVYRFDKSAIPSKLDVFEQLLRRITGSPVSDIIIAAAIVEMGEKQAVGVDALSAARTRQSVNLPS